MLLEMEMKTTLECPTTAQITELLTEMKSLMELKGENPFKIRAFSKASDTLESLGDSENWAVRAREGTLTEIPGIGKGIAGVLTDFILEWKTEARDELAASLPEGLLELTKVSGLGPKKAIQLIEVLQIKTLGELEYACRENRLLKLKGFGEKVQAKILENVQYLMQTHGQLRLVDAFPLAETILPILSSVVNAQGKGLRVSETGALRRRMETLSELEFIVETAPVTKTDLLEKELRKALESAVVWGAGKTLPLPVKFYFAPTSHFGTELARTTGTSEDWSALCAIAPSQQVLETFPAHDEEHFFSNLSIAWIPPEMRETGEEVELAKSGALSEILGWEDLRGCFHNHTTRSDGVATLEEMVLGAKARGMQYIGISDHSKSAFYAQGLGEPELLLQEKEIRALQEKHPEIRIFWGIESDILADGSLDYEDSVLKRFDFVVASVHSRFQMDRTTMTERILQAVRNPRTTMLGHLTGRLLLGRKGYDLEIDRIIRECGERGVGIEINANPARLDIDWRWGPELRREKCMVSVNPDAHDVAGLDDIRFGICVARKALLPKSLVLNTRSVEDVTDWLR